MRNGNLLRWGGWSAHIAAGLFTISIAASWITGGLEFRAWVPLFSVFACFLVTASLAAYDHLARQQYALARIGAAFAGLALFTLLLEAVAWGADQMIRETSPAGPGALTPMLALFNSLHAMVIWLIIFWQLPWGLGFIRLGGRAKMAGAFFCLNAAFLLVDYALLRLGQTGLPVELWHLGSQLMLLGALGVLGVILAEAASAAPDASP